LAVSGDDDGRLRIDGADVIIDDTLHAFQDRFGDVALDAGRTLLNGSASNAAAGPRSS